MLKRAAVVPEKTVIKPWLLNKRACYLTCRLENTRSQKNTGGVVQGYLMEIVMFIMRLSI